MGIQRALSRLIYGQEKHIVAQNATFLEFSMKEKHFGSHESVKSFTGIGNRRARMSQQSLPSPPLTPFTLFIASYFYLNGEFRLYGSTGAFCLTGTRLTADISNTSGIIVRGPIQGRSQHLSNEAIRQVKTSPSWRNSPLATQFWMSHQTQAVALVSPSTTSERGRAMGATALVCEHTT